MTSIEITDYNDSVQDCLDVLDRARPSKGIRDCSRDCKDAAEQIQNGQVPSQKDNGKST